MTISLKRVAEDDAGETGILTGMQRNRNRNDDAVGTEMGDDLEADLARWRREAAEDKDSEEEEEEIHWTGVEIIIMEILPSMHKLGGG